VKFFALVKKHKKLLIILATSIVMVPCLLIVICYYTINPFKKFVVPAQNAEHTEVGLVLGAGINSRGKPYKELVARLDSAADALNNGTVNKLILSGDNRFYNYNEPEAMKQYLVEKRGIDAKKLVRDYAGRSTYESCERAAKIFGVNKLIIFSAGSHLPRAIYLCKHFGIDVQGISSRLEADNSTRRELLARVKAVYNVKLVGERTVLGESIPLN
jgi:vancomycin permeability regulator SanA